MKIRRCVCLSLVVCIQLFAGVSIADVELAPYDVRNVDEKNDALLIGNSQIDVHFSDPSLYPKREILLDWIGRSAQVVHHYYGQFPVNRVSLALITYDGGGVDGGRQFSGKLPILNVTVGNRVTEEELRRDWIMVHEMVHLALADLPHFNRWLEEGLAVYVESIARAQVGDLDEDFVWRGFFSGMPHGLPKAGDRGLDNTPTWGRRYWGGALFCLIADIEIRKKINNRHSLQDALRAIVNAGYTTNIESVVTPILKVGDEAVGVDVLVPLYEKMRANPETPELETIWSSLGISSSGNTVLYNDDAPLAHVRSELMKTPPAYQ